MGFLDLFFKRSGVGFINNRNFRPEDPELNKFITFNEEYSKELALKASQTESVNFYSNNGVQLSEVKETPNVLKLTYSGLLARNGAGEIYSVIGYGDNQSWEDTNYFPMNKVDSQTFELVFPINKTGNINIAFKDGFNNWDNNSGNNYSFFNGDYKGSH